MKYIIFDVQGKVARDNLFHHLADFIKAVYRLYANANWVREGDKEVMVNSYCHVVIVVEG